MFQDERGKIRDLLTIKLFKKKFGITYVTFNTGAVRGNHYHKHTWQIDLVWGNFEVKVGSYYYWFNKVVYKFYKKFGFIIHKPHSPHAYKALSPSRMLVFVWGKRAGGDYEKDTFRLTKPLI